MALEVWCRSDVQNALRAAEHSGTAVLKAGGLENDVFVVGYQVGYRAALTTLALAFGLVPMGPRAVRWSMRSADKEYPDAGVGEAEMFGEEA